MTALQRTLTLEGADRTQKPVEGPSYRALSVSWTFHAWTSSAAITLHDLRGCQANRSLTSDRRAVHPQDLRVIWLSNN
jgi:hypothetical protein